MTVLASQSYPEDVAICHLQSPLFLTQKILEDRGSGDSLLWSQGDFGKITEGGGCKHAFLSTGCISLDRSAAACTCLVVF